MSRRFEHADRDTVSLVSLSHLKLSRHVAEAVGAAGYGIKPAHSAVFGQIDPDGSRLTDLARGANMTPQGIGQLVDELEHLGYVARRPDPTDRRAKLITLTESGRRCVTAGAAIVSELERRIAEALGEKNHAEFRRMLLTVLEDT
jgi:DNA-binding MarR family transcriptional regulator